MKHNTPKVKRRGESSVQVSPITNPSSASWLPDPRKPENASGELSMGEDVAKTCRSERWIHRREVVSEGLQIRLSIVAGIGHW